jgi:hypothetical protein
MPGEPQISDEIVEMYVRGAAARALDATINDLDNALTAWVATVYADRDTWEDIRAGLTAVLPLLPAVGPDRRT